MESFRVKCEECGFTADIYAHTEEEAIGIAWQRHGRKPRNCFLKIAYRERALPPFSDDEDCSPSKRNYFEESLGGISNWND